MYCAESQWLADEYNPMLADRRLLHCAEKSVSPYLNICQSSTTWMMGHERLQLSTCLGMSATGATRCRDQRSKESARIDRKLILPRADLDWIAWGCAFP